MGLLTKLAALDPSIDINKVIGSDSEAPNSMANSPLFSGTGNIVETVIKIILYVVGILAIIMLVFGGITYIAAAGDESKIKKAKNTIIYAIVGLAIAILAWTITNFVFSSLV